MADKKPETEAGPEEPVTSESEQLLFGGPLRYDIGWPAHEDAFLQLHFRAMLTRLPAPLASSLRLARDADRGAATAVLAAESGRPGDVRAGRGADHRGRH